MVHSKLTNCEFHYGRTIYNLKDLINIVSNVNINKKYFKQWPSPPGKRILKAHFRNRERSLHIVNLQWDKQLPREVRPEEATAVTHLVQCEIGRQSHLALSGKRSTFFHNYEMTYFVWP